MQRLLAAALTFTCLFFVSPAYARHHHHRSGACDGIHRCTCGSTQARHFGFPRMYHGHNLWEAREWGRAFPRTHMHAGAVGVYPHHVFRVVSVIDGHRAIVADERGQYERNVSGAIFVDANGSYARPAAVHYEYGPRDISARI